MPLTLSLALDEGPRVPSAAARPSGSLNSTGAYGASSGWNRRSWGCSRCGRARPLRQGLALLPAGACCQDDCPDRTSRPGPSPLTLFGFRTERPLPCSCSSPHAVLPSALPHLLRPRPLLRPHVPAPLTRRSHQQAPPSTRPRPSRPRPRPLQVWGSAP